VWQAWLVANAPTRRVRSHPPMEVDLTHRCCAGLGGGGGSGVARELPQVLAELAQKVLCGLCRSALHDQTLQLRPLVLDPLAGLRHPFLDAVGADGLCHSYLQPRLLNDERRHLVPGGTPHRNAVSRQERKRRRCQRLSSRYVNACGPRPVGRCLLADACWNEARAGIVSSHRAARS